MLVNRTFGNQNWIDISSPNQEELDSLVMLNNIDPLVVRDLLTPTPIQYVKDFGEGIYVVIHIPSFKHSHSENSEQEIDIIITENILITTRYDSVDALHYFAKEVEVEDILNREKDSHLFFGMMQEIYKFLDNEIEYIKDWTKEAEKNIFRGKEKEMVSDLSEARRNLITFKRIVAPHNAIWQKMFEIGEDKFEKHFTDNMKNLIEDWRRLMLEVDNVREILEELRDTNNSLLTTKQNETMKIFTILAFVTFPLSLIAAIFGMNTADMPIIGSPNDFWRIISLMSGTAIAMFLYFKYKKWI